MTNQPIDADVEKLAREIADLQFCGAGDLEQIMAAVARHEQEREVQHHRALDAATRMGYSKAEAALAALRDEMSENHANYLRDLAIAKSQLEEATGMYKREVARVEKLTGQLNDAQIETQEARRLAEHYRQEEQSAIVGRDKAADVAIAARKALDEARGLLDKAQDAFNEYGAMTEEECLHGRISYRVELLTKELRPKIRAVLAAHPAEPPAPAGEPGPSQEDLARVVGAAIRGEGVSDVPDDVRGWLDWIAAQAAEPLICPMCQRGEPCLENEALTRAKRDQPWQAEREE